jgi:hypothetical protein
MNYTTQNDLLLGKLLEFYKKDGNLDRMLSIINGNSRISLRIVDWFATNYAKKNYTVYNRDETSRFKVYIDYKLKLKAYSKRRFDPFCRWDRITIPYNDTSLIQTTIGQLNFFKWALENGVIDYIDNNYISIENDMNSRNSTSRRALPTNIQNNNQKTRKKREELSISASKSIKREEVEITVEFN